MRFECIKTDGTLRYTICFFILYPCLDDDLMTLRDSGAFPRVGTVMKQRTKDVFFYFGVTYHFNNSYHLTFTAYFPFKSSYAKRQVCALQIISTVSSEHALVMSQLASLSLWSSCFYYTINPQLMERASRRAIVKYWNIDKRSSQSSGDRWLHTEKSWRTLMLRLGKRNVYCISVSKAKPKHKWSHA